ncbi:MAG: beta-phosphoglucomutase family hydrolase [Candidatus Competibacteraceae bacterium]
MMPIPPAFIISPTDWEAVIFDLDGIVTDTARLHAAAWKQLFDDYLRQRSSHDGEIHRPFDKDADYHPYVDGKLRYEGVRSFLASRGITLPYGTPEDGPERETVCGLGNKKNALFLQRLQTQGVDVYPSSVHLLERLRAAGIKTALVTASKNCDTILHVTGLSHLFNVKVDGVVAARLGLESKPDPATFLQAARELGSDPAHGIVVEDAIAGVQAGHNGRFGCVIGVARTVPPEELKNRGADVVVHDLAEVVVGGSDIGSE